MSQLHLQTFELLMESIWLCYFHGSSENSLSVKYWLENVDWEPSGCIWLSDFLSTGWTASKPLSPVVFRDCRDVWRLGVGIIPAVQSRVLQHSVSATMTQWIMSKFVMYAAGSRERLRQEAVMKHGSVSAALQILRDINPAVIFLFTTAW